MKWFNAAKGFGLICPSSGEDVFVHHTAIQASGYRTLEEGADVEFEARRRPHKGLQAQNLSAAQARARQAARIRANSLVTRYLGYKCRGYACSIAKNTVLARNCNQDNGLGPRVSGKPTVVPAALPRSLRTMPVPVKRAARRLAELRQSHSRGSVTHHRASVSNLSDARLMIGRCKDARKRPHEEGGP